MSERVIITYHDVDVGGTHGVAVHHLQKLIRRAVRGQRVGRGVVAVEPVLAVLVGAELAAEVVGGLVIRVLEVVLAVGRRLPDVEDGVGDGLAGDQVADDTVHETDAAVGSRVLDDGASVLTERGIGGPEGSENGGRCGVNASVRHDLVGYFINEAEIWLAWLDYGSSRLATNS